MLKKISRLDFITTLGLYFAGANFLAIILSAGGFFYQPIIVTYFFAGIFFFAYLFFHKLKYLYFDWKKVLFWTFTGTFILFLSLNTSWTIFSGRDQGSLSEAAIRLSQNHRLEWKNAASEEFFKIYGPGQALNFPGFAYTEDGSLVTQFPLGYVSWLAAFYSLFGPPGLVAANAVSLFLFLAAFYLVARKYLEPPRSFLALGFVLSSYLFSWFFKYTLSENLALFLLWFGIWEFVVFCQEKKPSSLFASLFYLYILMYCRIETWAFLSVVIAILYLKRGILKDISRQLINKRSVFSASALVLFFFSVAFINQPFWREFIKGFLRSMGYTSQNTGGFLPFSYQLFYILKVFNAYSLLSFLILGLAGFVYIFRKKKSDKIIPFLIILPAFIYVFHPGITLDHPWMLRRFVFAIVPGCILGMTIFLDKTFRTKWLFWSTSAIIILANLAVSVPYLGYSENNGLLPQVEKLSRKFSKNDLVLIDREATGDGWTMMTGPMSFLFGKQAIYFFNPLDLGKLDVSKFENIYLITPEKNIAFYDESDLKSALIPQDDYLIRVNRLEVKTAKKSELLDSSVELPHPQDETITGKIFLYRP